MGVCITIIIRAIWWGRGRRLKVGYKLCGYCAVLTLIGKPSLGASMESKDEPNSKDARTWTWWPTWYELKSHYFKEVGFLACLSQMIGATIFVSEEHFIGIGKG